MRLTLPLLACLASMSLAAPIATSNDLVPRDTIIIDRAITRIETALANLQKTVDAYYFAPMKNPAIQQRLINDDSQDAVTAMTQGAQSISQGPPANELEKARVSVNAKRLLDQIRKTSEAWVRAKTLIVSNGGRGAIAEVVKRQANAANQFATALVAKMPGGNRDNMAFWYQKEVNQAVASAVAAYN